MLWGNTDSKSATGTIAIANVDADAIYGTLTGTSTLFGDEVKIGNYIIADGRKFLLVAITSNTAGVVASDLTGVALANVGAGNTFTVQEGPAFIGSEDKGDLDEIFGVDITEATLSGNASVQQYVVTFAGSGYSANATVTVEGNATANAQANSSGRISAVKVVLAGNTYTLAPSAVVAAPSAVAFNGNTNVSGATIAISTANSKFLVGDKVVYSGNTLSTPAELTDGSTYFVAFSNTTVVTLAATLGGANIALTKAAGDTTTAAGAALTGETATASAVLSAGGDKSVAHAGWVKRTVGTGGRAGRVFYETLVAGGTIGGDQEDAVFKDA
jgi:hypothetical protein